MRTHCLLRSRRFALCILFLIALAPVATTVTTAEAASYSGIVIDAKTGKVLYSERADARAYPASLTKMMTLYMLFEALEAGKVSKSTRIVVSKRAASMQPSKLGIKAGGSVSAEQAILALVTKSANDIASAVGEHLAGSESAFADKMTRKARELGMKSTTFTNASGLPNSAQVTTARDMAQLGIALREHFPQYYPYFSTRSFTYGRARMGNHNRLLGVVKGVDGIKTGYTRASGFNLVTSVRSDGRSIVAAVMGGKTGGSRNAQMKSLITRYLSKASRGEDRMLVARKDSSPQIASAAGDALPSRGPVPVFRVDPSDPMAKRIVVAHAVSDQGLDQVSADDSAPDIVTIERKLRQMSGQQLPVPAPSPEREEPDPMNTGAIQVAASDSNGELGQREVAAPSRPDWQIQIGATDSQTAALGLLQKARTRAPDVLTDRMDYTETVEKNGATLYRARFAGFNSKSSARDACGKLKRKKFACLAIEN